jgi:hypothetical protein
LKRRSAWEKRLSTMMMTKMMMIILNAMISPGLLDAMQIWQYGCKRRNFIAESRHIDFRRNQLSFVEMQARDEKITTNNIN